MLSLYFYQKNLTIFKIQSDTTDPILKIFLLDSTIQSPDINYTKEYLLIPSAHLDELTDVFDSSGNHVGLETNDTIYVD